MFVFSNDKSKDNKKDCRYDELEKLVWEFFINKIPRIGFESREGQEDMALDICSSIKDKQHTIIEAGVGIGKSYAYIVPLIYYNMLFNKPVLIATSTIALQEQLIKDIKSISLYINHKPEIILAKGMTHFACRSRAENYFKNISHTNMEEEIGILHKYIEIGEVDRKNINMDVDDKLWDSVNIIPTDHSRCKYFKNCRFMQLRENMMKTKGVIICNQDLLTVHLQKIKKGQKGLLNSEIELFIIDEAHNLEEKVRSSLVESYNINKIQSILSEANQNIAKSDEKNNVFKMIKLINSILNKIFSILDSQIKSQINNGYKFEEVEKFFVEIEEIEYLLFNLIKKVNSIYKSLKLYGNDNMQQETIENIEDLQQFLESMLDTNGKNLFWLEKYKGIKIFSCPKNMDKEINRLYFDNMKTTILTSATIANKNEGSEEDRYEYFIKSTGFPVEKGFLSIPKNSPFPYDYNTMIYYKESMPHPTYNRKDYIEKASEEIVKILNITKGKSLILFTSKNDLNEVYKNLQSKNLGYSILKQKITSSQDEVIEAFKDDEDSVLLATGTFWEGIDVPGKALSNLIIFKLPFPVPDPIIEYKKSISKNFLMEVSVPLMIVKLRQGIGRLVRKYDDIGIISILDSRISDSEKRIYKDIVFNSLPTKNKTNDIEIIREFWNKKIINKG